MRELRRCFTRPFGAAGGVCVVGVGVVCFVLGLSWHTISVAALVCVLVPVVVIDVRSRLIPDAALLAGLPLILVGTTIAAASWWVPLAGAAIGGGFLLGLWIVHPAGMGLGDVKLAAVIGLVVGWRIVDVLFVAFFAGAIIGMALVIHRGVAARRFGLPFAPFLAFGVTAAFVDAIAPSAIVGLGSL